MAKETKGKDGLSANRLKNKKAMLRHRMTKSSLLLNEKIYVSSDGHCLQRFIPLNRAK